MRALCSRRFGFEQNLVDLEIQLVRQQCAKHLVGARLENDIRLRLRLRQRSSCGVVADARGVRL